MGPNGTSALASLAIVAAAQGHFTSDGTTLAVLTSDPGAPPSTAMQLWLLSIDAAGVVTPTASPGGALSTTCVLAAAPTKMGSTTDDLLVFDGDMLHVYTAGESGFVESTAAVTTTFAYRAYDVANPPKYVPHPLVARIAGGSADPADVILRATTGELVAFWGEGGGAFTETKLFDAPACDVSPCAGQAVAQITLGPTDAKQLVRVGPGIFEFYAVNGRNLSPVSVGGSLTVPAMDTDYTNVQAADFDGDGVEDLAVMTSGTTLHLLRGIPERQ